MRRTHFFFILIAYMCLFIACGVRSPPLPPIEPPMIGRGEPSFSEATKDIQLKKKKPKKIPGDWDEPKEFEEEKSQ